MKSKRSKRSKRTSKRNRTYKGGDLHTRISEAIDKNYHMIAINDRGEPLYDHTLGKYPIMIRDDRNIVHYVGYDKNFKLTEAENQYKTLRSDGTLNIKSMPLTSHEVPNDSISYPDQFNKGNIISPDNSRWIDIRETGGVYNANGHHLYPFTFETAFPTPKLTIDPSLREISEHERDTRSLSRERNYENMTIDELISLRDKITESDEIDAINVQLTQAIQKQKCKIDSTNSGCVMSGGKKSRSKRKSRSRKSRSRKLK